MQKEQEFLDALDKARDETARAEVDASQCRTELIYFQSECERYKTKLDEIKEGGGSAAAPRSLTRSGNSADDIEQRLFEQTLTLEAKERKIALLVKEKQEVEGLLQVEKRRVARLGADMASSSREARDRLRLVEELSLGHSESNQELARERYVCRWRVSCIRPQTACHFEGS